MFPDCYLALIIVNLEAGLDFCSDPMVVCKNLACTRRTHAPVSYTHNQMLNRHSQEGGSKCQSWFCLHSDNLHHPIYTGSSLILTQNIGPSVSTLIGRFSQVLGYGLFYYLILLIEGGMN